MTKESIEDILLGGAMIEGAHEIVELEKRGSEQYVWHVHYQKGRMCLTNMQRPYSQGTLKLEGKAIARGKYV